MRGWWFASGIAVALAASFAAAHPLDKGGAKRSEAGDSPLAAWLRDGNVETRALSSSPPRNDAAALPATVPLGSLWKLFVYAYAVERDLQEPAYVCRPGAARTRDDEYCCAPGESVERDAALAKSCAPYFDPARLGIAASDWRAHWQQRAAPAWLADLERLRPDARIPPRDLLAALAAVPAPARAEARRALLDVAVTGYGREALATLGTGVRYKTYTWHRADRADVTVGGAAGWLADGTPFWFGARGASRSALERWAPALADALPAPRWPLVAREADGCVDVDFFARYPIRAVWHDGRPERANPGRLDGRYRIEFENGNWLRIDAGGALTLEAGDAPAIAGRFALDEYVARVVDREGDATQREAGKALAVAARTYLVQNASFAHGCWRIADASRTQRVNPNPPSAAARAAASFTSDLVLGGAAVRYHRDVPGVNRMAWRTAVAQGANGARFDRILAVAYPRAELATLSGRESCTPIDAAERWLAGSSAKWARVLRSEPGFEPLDGALRVCALADGRPYADQERLRIYARGWRSLDERITLAHEYLHLAFRNHPRGADEDFVERTARRLVEGAP